MLGLGWLSLRQAQEALRNGRLEEAQRLLQQPAVLGHKGSWELLQQLARSFAERGERHLGQEDSGAAWNDLLLAEQVGAEEPATQRLRQGLTRLGLDEVRALLEAGDPNRAGEMIARLRERAVRIAELGTLEEAAREWEKARDLAGRGEFAQALQMLERVRRWLPGSPKALERSRTDAEQRGRSFQALLLRLHEAANRKDWNETLALAEQVLALAPNHPEARKVRIQAWKAIEPVTVALSHPSRKPERPPEAEPSPRFLLWIDGIGGYLVCLGNRLTLGQAVPETKVDVPLLADISRLHATLTRDTEGYLLEAGRSVQVNGQPVERALLHPGDRVTLGRSSASSSFSSRCRSALGPTGLASGHRLRLPVDGVLLMADTLVLGPEPQAHVAMPDLEKPVILFRTREGLGVRCPGKLVIDGQPCDQRGLLGSSCTVSGEDFSLAIEPV